jgi:hypothetical protein
MSSMSLNALLSLFSLSSGTEKSHWGQDPVNREHREGVPAVICLLAEKNYLTDTALI